MTDVVFRTLGLTKTYCTGVVEVRALRGVGLELPSGEMSVLLGARARASRRLSQHSKQINGLRPSELYPGSLWSADIPEPPDAGRHSSCWSAQRRPPSGFRGPLRRLACRLVSFSMSAARQVW
jgi:hypothetical protein